MIMIFNKFNNPFENKLDRVQSDSDLRYQALTKEDDDDYDGR